MLLWWCFGVYCPYKVMEEEKQDFMNVHAAVWTDKMEFWHNFQD